jgi:GH35 family endo-1,4-beta-xylanase
MKTNLLLMLMLMMIEFSISAQQKPVLTTNEIYKQAHQNIEKYRKADFSVQLSGVKTKNLADYEIAVEQVSHDFLFGCIIFDLVNHGKNPGNDSIFKERFKHIFNFAVFPFYWAGYEQRPGQTNEQKIKEVAAWCLENGITPKGHPLCWGHTAGTPEWFAGISHEERWSLQQKRIENIVSGFKNQIAIWDVVNEAVNTVPWSVASADLKFSDGNRYGKPYPIEAIAGYVDTCYTIAHRANPEAHLILNEFGQEVDPLVRQRFFDLVKRLQAKKTPIDAVGIQQHEPNAGRYYYSPQEIWNLYEKYAELGMPYHITELIQVSNGDSIKGNYKTGIWTEQEQAECAEMMFTLAFGYPLVKSINWWGMWDGNIWQEKGGLVDEKFNPKPVYTVLDQLINHAWKTKTSNLKPDAKGNVSFRGFKGDYKVTVKKNGLIVKEEKLKYNDNLKPLIVKL